MTERKKERSKGNCEQVTYIVNELLASLIHAFQVRELSVEDAMNRFYTVFSATDLERAYAECASVCELPLRCKSGDKTRKHATDMFNLFGALSKVDWNSATVRFVAVNTDKVVRVENEDPAYRDMYRAIRALEEKLAAHYDEKLGELCNTVQLLQSKLEKMTVNAVPHPTRPATYSSAVKDDKTSNREQTRKKVTNITLPIQHPQPTENQWKTVKPKKSKKPPVTGLRSAQSISSCDVRPLRLFVSRCSPTTTTAKLKDYLSKEHDWNILEVVSLQAKYNTYTSFKVVLDRKDGKVKDFLDPQCWPQGLLVRIYRT